jgi:murein DD-endopeptidase MepM/ murein hydrolase activator NlpD
VPQSNRARRCRRIGTGVAAVVAVCCAATVTASAQETTTTTKAEAAPRTEAEAQARVDAARAEADAAAQRLTEAISRFEVLGDEIAALETRIAEGRVELERLRAAVERRAVAAYQRRSDGDAEVIVQLLEGHSFGESLRRTNLIAAANDHDDQIAADLRALELDLDHDRHEAVTARAQQEKAMATLEAERKVVEAKVAAAEQAREELKARFAREAAARAASAAATRSGPAGVVIVNPGGGPFQCPVNGAFTNDWGQPRSGGRSHRGTDIFASTGTPVVAVSAGSVAYSSDSSGGGNTAVLTANGNAYNYLHLSGFAGGARSVVQGEVLGYVGMTGNATAPHLHFEIQTGSGAINPYPTLSQYC